MKITSVICEYNPFHLGHAYQLSEMRRTESAVIAVMSGSFTERGSAAVLSKYERARLAILNGADLVLELPFPFCSARADRFGMAGVKILHALGCVDTLCFGSESGDIHSLVETDRRLASEEFEAALSKALANDRKRSHIEAMSAVYKDLYGNNTSLGGSNDILALSYLAALRKEKSEITPIALKRIGESYNGEGTGFASATSIRKQLTDKNFDAIRASVPQAVAEALEYAETRGEIAEENALYPLFASLVRTRDDILTDIPDIPPELLVRMKKAAKTAENTETFLSLASARQYSPSRIRRGVLYAVCNVKEEDFSSVPYTTVLAANATGREILSQIRKSANIAIITKPADAKNCGEDVFRAFSLSARADSIWSLLLPTPHAGDKMMKEHPRML